MALNNTEELEDNVGGSERVWEELCYRKAEMLGDAEEAA